MGSKWARELEAADSTNRGSILPLAKPRLKKRRRHNPSDFDSRPSDSLSVNRLKAKIRDTNRLLNHAEKLPAGVRIEKERALAGYQYDLEQASKEKRKQKMIGKYHMVRFFERKKATRLHKQIQKRLSTAPKESTEYEALQADLHNAEVDVNYTIYHPLDEKYHSLYPRNEPPIAGEEHSDNRGSKQNGTPKPKIWAVVETCMEEGTLEALRNGKLGRELPDVETKPSRPHTARHNGLSEKPNGRDGKSKRRRDALPKQDEEWSDGGFFET